MALVVDKGAADTRRVTRLEERAASVGERLDAWGDYRRLARVLTGVVGGAFAVALWAGRYYAPMNSDTVAQQNIIQSVAGGAPLDAVVPSDSWWLHLPAYLATEILPNGPWQIFAQAVAMNAVLVIGLLVYTRILLRTVFPSSRLALVVSHLALAWFLGLPVHLPGPPSGHGRLVNGDAVALFMTPNHRNLELGVALLVLALFTRAVFREEHLSRRAAVAVATGGVIGIAALVSSDPYFMYVFGGAGAVTLVWFWLARTTSGHVLLAASASLGGGLVLGILARWALGQAGLSTINATERSFIWPGDAGTSLMNTVAGVSVLFRGSFWGMPFGPTLGPVALNVLLLVGVLGGLVVGARRSVRRTAPAAVPALALIGVALCAYAFSTLSLQIESFRYLLVPVVVAVPFAVFGVVPLIRRRQQALTAVLAVLVIGVLASVGLNVRASVNRLPGTPASFYALNSAIIEEAQDSGVAKGYASFWNANVNSYLSDRDVLFLPVDFDGTQFRAYGFLINLEDFDAPSPSSFVYVGNSDIFTVEDVVAAMGEPTEVESVPGAGTLVYFDRDVGADLPLWIPEVP